MSNIRNVYLPIYGAASLWFRYIRLATGRQWYGDKVDTSVKEMRWKLSIGINLPKSERTRSDRVSRGPLPRWQHQRAYCLDRSLAGLGREDTCIYVHESSATTFNIPRPCLVMHKFEPAPSHYWFKMHVFWESVSQPPGPTSQCLQIRGTCSWCTLHSVGFLGNWIGNSLLNGKWLCLCLNVWH